MTTLYTIGHSTRSAEDFLELLAENEIRRLVDVRQFPGSRRHPQFSSEALAASLAEANIRYVHRREFGGRRKPTPESANAYWQNESFRAYADYMSTPEFVAALDDLVADAETETTAIMCAEAVPWRCHRWLISDALVSRGFDVVHILGPKQTKPHALNPNAVVSAGGRLTYPGLFPG